MPDRKYMVAPLALWHHKDLTLAERAVLVELYALTDDQGRYDRPFARIAANLSIPKHVAQDTLVALKDKGAVSVSLNDKGDTVIVPHIDRRRYLPQGAEDDTDTKTVAQDAIDYPEVLSRWLDTNPALPQPRMFTPKMQQQLRTLLRNNRSSLDELYKVFAAVGCSDFLQGRTGRGDWKASLHWLLKDSNSSYQRIINGEFHHSQTERAALDEIFTPTVPVDNYYR